MKLFAILTVAAFTTIVNAAAIGEMRPAIPRAAVQSSVPLSTLEERSALEARRDKCGRMCFGPGVCNGKCSFCDLKYSKCKGQPSSIIPVS